MKYLESISFCLAVFIVALGCGGCTHYGYDFVCHDVAADASDSRAGEFARVKSRRLLEVLKTHPCNWESLAVDGHSLLIYAAEHDNIRLARYLIGRGGGSQRERRRRLDCVDVCRVVGRKGTPRHGSAFG